MRTLMLWVACLAVGASVAAGVQAYPLTQTDLAEPDWAPLYLMQW